MRTLSTFDRIAIESDRVLRTLFAPLSQRQRDMPEAVSSESRALSAAEEKHAAGLMRIDHAGEVAAQALYFGHAAAVSQPSTRAMMLHAAGEEADHLAWCTQRLTALHARPSVFGPLWYGGAYAMGYVSALFGDQIALGFVAETERQVEAHLKSHEQALPAADHASLSVIAAMRADEAAHGLAAKNAGAKPLPWPVPELMAKTADVMRFVAYRI
jgi:3-demethoxyubiquinol 3-hydroxylase